MRHKIYIDTSVFGGYYDLEFEVDTRLFFERIYAGDFDVYISEISKLELLPAPDHVRLLLGSIPKDRLTILELTKEALELADNYITKKILGKASINDAYHIAISTVHNIDVLVSWNFKHIVNLDKILLFNDINRVLGYPAIDIRPQKELIKYEE